MSYNLPAIGSIRRNARIYDAVYTRQSHSRDSIENPSKLHKNKNGKRNKDFDASSRSAPSWNCSQIAKTAGKLSIKVAIKRVGRISKQDASEHKWQKE